MKNLAINLQPLIYGAFPVCRNYTVRAHIRDLGTPKRCGCENRQQHAGSLRRWLYAPHLHPRHAADAAKSRGENGQLHGADSISPAGKQSTGKEAISSPVLFGSFRAFRCVGQGVGQSLTYTLTRNICGIFATKKHRKPKLSMLFGAGGVTRTHDLLITKSIGALRLTVFRAFGAFPLGILREVRLILSTVFVRSFPRVGHGVGQSFFPYTIGNRLHEIGQ